MFKVFRGEMHLCGALSPRLLTLCLRTAEVDAALLCPCCLKGKEEVRRGTAYDPARYYTILLEHSSALARDEAGDGDAAGSHREEREQSVRVSVAWDTQMLSPKNGFVRALKIKRSNRVTCESVLGCLWFRDTVV